MSDAGDDCLMPFCSRWRTDSGREASPVGRPDFKSGWGRETVPGGFDSHSLPPRRRETMLVAVAQNCAKRPQS
jgi:hypothetical protein